MGHANPYVDIHSMNKIINLTLISKVLSWNILIVSMAILFCSVIALVFSEPVSPFIFSFLAGGAASLFLYLISRKEKNVGTLERKDAFFTVTVSWLLMAFLGSLPYTFSNSIPSFVDAMFESASGFTTTGSSILTNIEILPKSILFWRSLTHWIGGIGFIVLVILIMPTLHIGGYHLFVLESSLQEKIQPKIKSVGIRVLVIYIGLTVAETILLLLGKMNLFDSICHAFGTVATGGFSPKNTSIGGYSPYVQYVIMAFMVLGGTNFIIHYYILKREFTKLKENEELKFYLMVILVIGFITTAVLFFKTGKPFELSIREAFFQVISIVTCTGYATADYLQWPQFAWLIIFFAMFLGGSTGSTAGGIKMARHLVLFKNIKMIFRQLVHQKAILKIHLNKNPMNEETNNIILTFISLYIFIFIVGTLLILATGVDLQTASSSAATSMAGIGPGIGTVGPASNFAHLTDFAKIVMLFLMITGRLEIYTVVILFTKAYWKV